jgi:23S rRNA pseudouridine2605 synthase
MTSKDKPMRGGGKPSGRDKKPYAASGKPGGAKPFRKGPPKGDRAEGEEMRAERPARAKPFAKKSYGDRPGGDRPAGDRPEGGRSFGGKPYGGKASGGKSFDGKPRAERPRDAARPPRVLSDAGMVAETGLKPERISKLLARAGVASRRDVERMIMDGRVRVNGVVLDTPVVNATLNDRIEVDGEPIRGIERTRLWLYHKPAGLVTTNADPEGRPTVFDNLPPELPRVLSIGRLDINTEGLLLLTNDGGLARVLELPSTGWLRRYRVRAHGDVDQAALDKLKEGIAVDGVLYGGIDATLDRQQGHNVWLTMGLREGKNREIKNVLGALGLDVNRLIRLSYGPFQLGDLPEGAVVEVRGRMLREQLGPRLIEESKANFDAPIYNNAPRDAEDGDEAEARPARRAAERPAKAERSERPQKPRDEKPRGGKPFGKPGFKDREADEAEFKPKRRTPGSSRTANVWMAPGARPVGEKEAARRKKIAPPNAKPIAASPDTKGPRVTVTRASEDKDWIRAESFGGKEKEEGGFGRKKSFGGRDGGDRPARSRDEGFRSDRPRSDRPRSDGPREDRPRGDRKFGDRAEGKSFGGKPRGERAFGDRSEGKSFGDKPGGERKFGDKPKGKSFGAKPGGKSFGGKPGGGRPSGGRPGGRPGGGKPRG